MSQEVKPSKVFKRREKNKKGKKKAALPPGKKVGKADKRKK